MCFRIGNNQMDFSIGSVVIENDRQQQLIDFKKKLLNGNNI